MIMSQARVRALPTIRLLRAQKQKRFSISRKFVAGYSRLREAVTCLTVSRMRPTYSSLHGITRSKHGRMSTKFSKADSPVGALKNEAARQRWELFHRAIAQAKKSNGEALEAAEGAGADGKPSVPLLSIAGRR
ncbi:MAG: hypothetical protein ACREQZ_13030 [Woeseiaceae bacterium]